MRRYPRIFSGPAALPLFCLAPHGVFRASRIAPRAVSSYLAFSPLPALKKEQLFSQRTGGVFSVTLSVNTCFRECCPRILRGMLPYGVRTFLQQIPLTRGSPAIICHRGGSIPQSGKQENRRANVQSKGRRRGDQKNGNHCECDD